MHFYIGSHASYSGVDLHARSMFTHVLDHASATVFARDLPAARPLTPCPPATAVRDEEPTAR
jgi:hypothetical protein